MAPFNFHVDAIMADTELVVTSYSMESSGLTEP